MRSCARVSLIFECIWRTKSHEVKAHFHEAEALLDTYVAREMNRQMRRSVALKRDQSYTHFRVLVPRLVFNSNCRSMQALKMSNNATYWLYLNVPEGWMFAKAKILKDTALSQFIWTVR